MEINKMDKNNDKNMELENQLRELKSLIKKALPMLYRDAEFRPYASDEWKLYVELKQLVEGN